MSRSDDEYTAEERLGLCLRRQSEASLSAHNSTWSAGQGRQAPPLQSATVAFSDVRAVKETKVKGIQAEVRGQLRRRAFPHYFLGGRDGLVRACEGIRIHDPIGSGLESRSVPTLRPLDD